MMIFKNYFKITLVFAVMLLASLSSIFIIDIINLNNYEVKIKILTIILAILNILPVVIMMYKRKIDFIHPLFIFLITFFAFFPLRAIYIIWNNDYQFITLIGADPFRIDELLIVIIISLLCFYMGIILSADKVIVNNLKKLRIVKEFFNQQLSSSHDYQVLRFYSNVLLLLAITGFLLFGLSQGSFLIGRGGTKLAGDNGYIYLAINLLIPCLLLKYIVLKESSKKNYFYFFVLLFIGIYLYTVLGGRYRLVMLLISLGTLFFYFNKLRLGRFLVIIASFMFTYLISIVGANRNQLYIGSSLNLKMELSTINVNFLSSKGDLNIFDTFLKIYEGIPSILPYQYGSTLLSLLIQPVPRAIFPMKPEYGSKLIMENLMPEYYEKGIGFAGSILSDFMLNFGVVGIFVGMLIFGIYIKLLIRLKNHGSIQSKLIFAVSISVLPFYIRGEFVGTSVWYLIVIIPILISFYLTIRKKINRN